MSNVSWRQWLRTLSNATTYLGLFVIVLMWAGVVLNFYSDERNYIAGARENGSNLTRAYAESVYRAVSEIDKLLLLIRSRISLEGDGFDPRSLAVDPLYSSDLVRSVAIISADGYRVLSTSEISEGRIDSSAREQYRVFLESPVDRLHITKPVVARSTGQWNIVFARPILSAGGKFRGVIGVSVDPTVLTRFFEIIDIGKEGRITLMGVDRTIRAARGGARNVLGQTAASSLWEIYPQSQSGNFYAQGFDGVRRLISFRKVKGLPLIASVGFSEKELLAAFSQNQRLDYLIAAGISLLILLGLSFNARHRARFDIAQHTIRASEFRAVEKSRELEITLEHMSQGLMMVDTDRNVAVINHQAVRLLGLPEGFSRELHKFDDVMSSLWEQGDFGKDGETLDPKVRDFIKAGGLDDIGTYERTRPNGTVLEVRSVPLPGGGLVRTFTDISIRKHSEERIAYMARHDDLTGLANRVLFREQIEMASARSRRTGERFAVLVIDLDRFKDVNDTLGHPAGDALLKIVAQRLCMAVREGDTVARLGGDEFAIVQSLTRGREDSQHLCRRILKAIKEPREISGTTVEIGTSIGIAVAPEDGIDAEDLLKKSDIALYCAKAEGRGDWRFFEAAMGAQARTRNALEYDLRRALHNHEFEVHYQPMIDLGSNEVCGVEALLRWHHPKKGLIAPSEFIPVAEEAGLILEIGEWVARKACSDAIGWPANIKVAVNLSPVQFKDRKLVEIIKIF